MAGSSQRFELAVVGMGGQGALLAGRILAEAGMHGFPYVTFFPNYATVMRGWPSESITILSDTPICSAIAFTLQAVILMHPRHLARYQGRVKPGGILILDSSLPWAEVAREDIRVVRIPASQQAVEMGDQRIANLVLLGAYVKLSQAVHMELVDKALETRMRGVRWEALLPLNKDALRRGAALATNGA